MVIKAFQEFIITIRLECFSMDFSSITMIVDIHKEPGPNQTQPNTHTFKIEPDIQFRRLIKRELQLLFQSI